MAVAVPFALGLCACGGALCDGLDVVDRGVESLRRAPERDEALRMSELGVVAREDVDCFDKSERGG